MFRFCYIQLIFSIKMNLLNECVACMQFAHFRSNLIRTNVVLHISYTFRMFFNSVFVENIGFKRKFRNTVFWNSSTIRKYFSKNIKKVFIHKIEYICFWISIIHRIFFVCSECVNDWKKNLKMFDAHCASQAKDFFDHSNP